MKFKIVSEIRSRIKSLLEIVLHHTSGRGCSPQLEQWNWQWDECGLRDAKVNMISMVTMWMKVFRKASFAKPWRVQRMDELDVLSRRIDGTWFLKAGGWCWCRGCAMKQIFCWLFGDVLLPPVVLVHMLLHVLKLGWHCYVFVSFALTFPV